jgi:ACR3 family arsenite efflux pump ArsB
MVVLTLILGLGIYIFIMFGLTFWLRRYHHYKNLYYPEASSQVLKSATDELTVECNVTPDPERDHCQKTQSERGEAE